MKIHQINELDGYLYSPKVHPRINIGPEVDHATIGTYKFNGSLDTLFLTFPLTHNFICIFGLFRPDSACI